MSGRNDPMYSEFDDVDMKRWPFVTSKKARAEMVRLASAHGMGFVFNPGGGCWRGNGADIQISTYDDVDDLRILRAELARRSTAAPREE